MPIASVLVLAAALSGNPAPVTDAQFQANSALALKNAGDAKGKAFDQALGQAIDKSAGFPAQATACLRRFPGDQAVTGYFEFTSATAYRVVLRPAGGFADCFAQALSGRAVPAPPSLPYLNPFAFTNHPGKPAVHKIVVTKDMLREPDGRPLKPAPKPAAKPTPAAAPAAATSKP